MLAIIALGQKAEQPLWPRGLDPKQFPIAVWLQSPANAQKYKAMGINLYVALWRGPTAEQLSALEKAGMRVICSQNKMALSNIDNPVIAGWMHGDEPDNAQSLGRGKGYGPPILPEKIIADYERIRSADPSRPILLNLGQGVAWDDYIGRGVRRRHPEDYKEYVKGGDIVSFDIYPVVHESPQIAGKLEYVANGVDRLREWTDGKKTVWNCIECTHISNPNRKATPEQVRSEVWMSLIHGSKGLIYFVHQFKPESREAGVLEDPEMVAGITKINKQVQELAGALLSPDVNDRVRLEFKGDGKIDYVVKESNGRRYLFAVNMRPANAAAWFNVEGGPVRVLGEERELKIDGKRVGDQFEAYAVHLYDLGPISR